MSARGRFTAIARAAGSPVDQAGDAEADAGDLALGLLACLLHRLYGEIDQSGLVQTQEIALRPVMDRELPVDRPREQL